MFKDLVEEILTENKFTVTVNYETGPRQFSSMELTINAKDKHEAIKKAEAQHRKKHPKDSYGEVVGKIS